MTIELFKADAANSRASALSQAEADALAQAKLRAKEADFTPRFVVRAILAWYFEHILRVVSNSDRLLLVQSHGFNRVLSSSPTKVIRILDVCAGAGVWASEVRRLLTSLGFEVHITAVELDEEREGEYLKRHADEVVFDDWRTFAKRCAETGRWFDLVIGNPAFTQARALKVGGKLDPHTSMPALLTEIAGAVILYMSQQGWTKTAPGFEVRRAYPPAYAVDVPGAINHREGENPKNGKRWSSDTVPYSATMWIGRVAGPHTGMMMSDMLEPLDGRSWKKGLRPGAEPIHWLRKQGIPYLEAA